MKKIIKATTKIPCCITVTTWAIVLLIIILICAVVFAWPINSVIELIRLNEASNTVPAVFDATAGTVATVAAFALGVMAWFNFDKIKKLQKKNKKMLRDSQIKMQYLFEQFDNVAKLHILLDTKELENALGYLPAVQIYLNSDKTVNRETYTYDVAKHLYQLITLRSYTPHNSLMTTTLWEKIQQDDKNQRFQIREFIERVVTIPKIEHEHYKVLQTMLFWLGDKDRAFELLSELQKKLDNPKKLRKLLYDYIQQPINDHLYNKGDVRYDFWILQKIPHDNTAAVLSWLGYKKLGKEEVKNRLLKPFLTGATFYDLGLTFLARKAQGDTYDTLIACGLRVTYGDSNLEHCSNFKAGDTISISVVENNVGHMEPIEEGQYQSIEDILKGSYIDELFKKYQIYMC